MKYTLKNLRILTGSGIVILLFLGMGCSSPTKEEKTIKKDNITVAAYYFPNYHEDKRNAAYHGNGWTEWKLVKEAKPRFEGHIQPNEPLWGYTDEANPQQMAQKIEAAASHGIDAFIFDWYYYNDGLFLERGLEKGFMEANNRDKIKFSLMWANHDWMDIHPMRLDKEPAILYPGTVTPEVFEEMTDYIIETYFKNESYWLIDGKPYFSVYDLQKLVESFGSIAATREALDLFREKTVNAGFAGLNLNAVIWGQPILPGEEVPSNLIQLVGDLGFDSSTSYVWIHHVQLDKFPQTPYNEVKDKYLEFVTDTRNAYEIPYYPNLTMGWDASPRCYQGDVLENKGYPFMATLSDNTPANFKEAARALKVLILAQPENERILTINCWNEWTEGSYLEPDIVNGMKYLEAIKELFE